MLNTRLYGDDWSAGNLFRSGFSSKIRAGNTPWDLDLQNHQINQQGRVGYPKVYCIRTDIWTRWSHSMLTHEELLNSIRKTTCGGVHTAIEAGNFRKEVTEALLMGHTPHGCKRNLRQELNYLTRNGEFKYRAHPQDPIEISYSAINSLQPWSPRDRTIFQSDGSDGRIWESESMVKANEYWRIVVLLSKISQTEIECLNRRWSRHGVDHYLFLYVVQPYVSDDAWSHLYLHVLSFSENPLTGAATVVLTNNS